ncbi:hypothetical protein [Streptomyces sp. 16-176A]|uniref:hypothetical protein n=1 Tax=Streptomyces sp. 16-176A TaxID=2530458 RepID=UPI00345CC727
MRAGKTQIRDLRAPGVRAGKIAVHPGAHGTGAERRLLELVAVTYARVRRVAVRHDRVSCRERPL